MTDGFGGENSLASVLRVNDYIDRIDKRSKCEHPLLECVLRNSMNYLIKTAVLLLAFSSQSKLFHRLFFHGLFYMVRIWFLASLHLRVSSKWYRLKRLWELLLCVFSPLAVVCSCSFLNFCVSIDVSMTIISARIQEFLSNSDDDYMTGNQTFDMESNKVDLRLRSPNNSKLIGINQNAQAEWSTRLNVFSVRSYSIRKMFDAFQLIIDEWVSCINWAEKFRFEFCKIMPMISIHSITFKLAELMQSWSYFKLAVSNKFVCFSELFFLLSYFAGLLDNF